MVDLIHRFGETEAELFRCALKFFLSGWTMSKHDHIGADGALWNLSRFLGRIESGLLEDGISVGDVVDRMLLHELHTERDTRHVLEVAIVLEASVSVSTEDSADAMESGTKRFGEAEHDCFYVGVPVKLEREFAFGTTKICEIKYDMYLWML